MMEYEYCVMHSNYPEEPHRGPWSKKDCVDWLTEWIEDGGRGGVFYLARRPIGNWERC